ncbi:MAG: hypothetical protein JXR25_08350 [Pontiellaceae bacterium]|nr:hypothetical protein [Pontiellaceae bacterium]MBN2784824.1 hypothetical protein [Pontiellaceae bacterium]
MWKNRRIKTAVGKSLALVLFAVSGALPAVHAEEGHWVTTWATATEGFTDASYLPPKVLAHNTVRMFVRTSAEGKLLRLRFSNAYGTVPVTINNVHIALAGSVNSSATIGDIDPTTDTALRFRGASSVAIPAGGEIYCDPVRFNLPALSLVAVSIHYGDIAHSPMTGHRGARADSFIADGNAVSHADLTGATTQFSWYTLTGIEVMAPASSGTVVIMGDSITDGAGTTYDYNTRWTDFFASRLSTNAPTAGVGIANMGIGGSTIIGSGLPRFQRDVLDQSAARWLVIFYGVNDIGGNQSASNIIAAYKSMADQAHARGLRVYGATVTPIYDSFYYTAAHETVRQEVNAWIMTNDVFDAYMDFSAAVMEEGSSPPSIVPSYTSDDLHMNASGYKVLAESIDLTLFEN